MPISIVLIGFGAIGQDVHRMLAQDAGARITQVLVRPERCQALQAELGVAIDVISSVTEIEEDVDLVLECAGHQAVRAFGPDILEAGLDLAVVSVGALADQRIQDALYAASAKTGAQTIILPGAIGGIDAIAAAGVNHLETVTYSGRKSPLSWAGTPAEDTHDLAALSAPTEIFSGSAREAAKAFPKNANVVATVALAGVGFDKTRVSLVADPAATANTHHITAQGPLLDLSFVTQGKTTAHNPKTSALTAMSVLRAIRNRARWISI